MKKWIAPFILVLGGVILFLVNVSFYKTHPNGSWVERMNSLLSEREKPKAYLAFYFKDIGAQDGLFLAGSEDGIHWEQWNKDSFPLFRSTLKPNGVFRDPSVFRDKKGIYRMVWTVGRDGFGYSSSDDLIHWEEAKLVKVAESSDKNPWKNVWAPEIYFNEKEETYYVLWAATFKNVVHPNEQSLPWYKHKYDHRHYYQTTQDWKTFSKPERFPGPEISHYDGMLFREKDRVWWIYKHKGKLWLSSSNHVLGPYTKAKQLPGPETPVEGGYALRVGKKWFVYFDEFLLGGKYGFVSSDDLVQWSEPQRVQADFVMRHGSFVSISLQEWQRLKKNMRKPDYNHSVKKESNNH